MTDNIPESTIYVTDEEYPYSFGEITRHIIHLIGAHGQPIADVSLVEDTGGALSLFVQKYVELGVGGPMCDVPKVLATFTQPGIERPADFDPEWADLREATGE